MSLHASDGQRHVGTKTGRERSAFHIGTATHPHVPPSSRRTMAAVGAPWTLLGLVGVVLLGNPAAAEELDRLQSRRTPVVEVFEATRNAVVNISTTRVIEQVYAPRGIGSLFDEIFPLPRMRRYRSESVGSGFVLHADGYIVTNYHVVARTAERKVIFADNREYDAEVVAFDMQRDLAVLKIMAHSPLQPLRLGRSNDLMVGETVIAIGNPLGYQHTVTAGVVSALDRKIEVDRGFQFTNLIQTDASINPGNSGGPLLNVLGELIGITTAIRADAENIGFAIPVDGLRKVLPEMLAVERRYGFVLGLTVANLENAIVTETRHGSPAAEAGIRIGDVVRGINGSPIESGIDFHIRLIGQQAGETISLRLEREERMFDLPIQLAEQPRPDGTALLMQRFGLEVHPMTQRHAERLGFRRPAGVIITSVQRDSPAKRGGLQPGHLILRIRIGRSQASTLTEMGTLLATAMPGQPVDLDVLQVGGVRWLLHIVTLAAR